jgi:hypothetical protein
MQEQLLLTAMALFAGAALVLSFLRGKAQRIDPEPPHQKAQREYLHRLVQGVDPGLPHQKAQRVGIEHEFNKLLMTASKEGKEALIGLWMARQKCGRLEAMRLATEEWRRENRY